MTSIRSIAHVGIRTTRFVAMLAWYETFLEAKVLFRNEVAAFLTFDDEHHRLVLWTDPATVERPADVAGIEHICLGLGEFGALAAAYERLETAGIEPFLPVNHRFTTSLYYRDPDGNEVELSVDNFAARDAGVAFLQSGDVAAILTPPFGDVFDPRELVRMVAAGASREELSQLGRA